MWAACEYECVPVRLGEEAPPLYANSCPPLVGQWGRPALIGQVEAIYSLTAPSHEWLSINLFKKYLELSRLRRTEAKKCTLLMLFRGRGRSFVDTTAGTRWGEGFSVTHTHTHTRTRGRGREGSVCGDAARCVFLRREKLQTGDSSSLRLLLDFASGSLRLGSAT